MRCRRRPRVVCDGVRLLVQINRERGRESRSSSCCVPSLLVGAAHRSGLESRASRSCAARERCRRLCRPDANEGREPRSGYGQILTASTRAASCMRRWSTEERSELRTRICLQVQVTRVVRSAIRSNRELVGRTWCGRSAIPRRRPRGSEIPSFGLAQLCLTSFPRPSHDAASFHTGCQAGEK